MTFEEIKQAAAPLLLVSDPVAALRWEVAWLGGRSDGRTVAPRPGVLTVTRAVDRMLAAEAAGLGDPPALSPLQSAALWREIVADSGYGRRLVSPAPAAASAASAWGLLHEWDVPWQSLRSDGDDLDFEALLAWCHAYRARLTSEGWRDRHALICELASRDTTGASFDIAVALSRSLTPAVARAFTRRSRGGSIRELTDRHLGRRHVLLRPETPAEELRAAAEWAARHLTKSPSRPVAMVIPDLRSRLSAVESVLGDVAADCGSGSGPIPARPWAACGKPLAGFAAPAAALNALELLLGQGRFGHFSAFLRSPFFPADEREPFTARCDFEVGYRQELLAQWRFADALHRGGLRSRLIAALPVSVGRLERALRIGDDVPGLLTPSQWVDVWQRMLRALDWRSAAFGTPADVLTGWDQALQRFASLSAIVGRIGATRALGEFRRVVMDLSVRPPMPMTGIHVLERPEQVGPGYAGVWVSGFTDRNWPAPVRLNPLLPARLQRAHGMHGSTPDLAYAASRAVLARLTADADGLVFSAPRRHDDEALRPSRMLALDEVAVPGGVRTGYVSGRIAARPLRVLPDPAPAFERARLTGGVRLLELQAACPVRAFCEIRLGARALERLRYGLPPRVRGIALHRALELLFAPYVGAGPVSCDVLASGVDAAIEGALTDSVPWHHPPWDLIARLEGERARRAIVALLDKERARGALDVAAVEMPIELELENWSLRGRIDRIDRTADGARVLFDYKTGSAPASSGWYGERLIAPQMPAYALACGDRVGAFVVVSLGDGQAEFRSAGALPREFATTPRPVLAGKAWQGQLHSWRIALAALLREFTSGDVRIFTARPELATGAYAPLTRVFGIRAESVGNDVTGDSADAETD